MIMKKISILILILAGAFISAQVTADGTILDRNGSKTGSAQGMGKEAAVIMFFCVNPAYAGSVK